MYGWEGWGWGAWVAMGFMMLVFLGVIAAVVIVLLRQPGRQEPPAPPQPPPGDPAMRVLDERFARGEIDEQEYRAKRDLLRTG